MHVALGVSSFSYSAEFGGVERVAANLAASMRRRGHDITIFSLNYERLAPPLPCYPLPPGVQHRALDAADCQANITALRRLLLDMGVDVFVSLQMNGEHLRWLAACNGTGIPFVYSEHNSPEQVEGRFWSRAGRLAALSGADSIHLLLPDYANSIPEVFRAKVRVIPNAATPGVPLADPIGQPGKRKTLLYMARFAEQKNPELMLRAFRLLLDNHPDWDLRMYGIGPLERRCRRLLRRWRLGTRVSMLGLCRDAPVAYAQAQAYCLPSGFEGFPVAILEAMSAGLPIVALAHCHAMRAVLDDGKTALLAPKSTPKSLADTLDRVMGDAGLRSRLAAEALKAACAYAPEAIEAQWEALLLAAFAQKGHTVMDAFTVQPTLGRLLLSEAARREWVLRPSGVPLPRTTAWILQRISMLCRHLPSAVFATLRTALRSVLPRTP